MPTSERERIVRAFLLLLHRESKKSESAIIPPTAWENLPELQAGLAQANDDIKIIARAITKWCKEHQYSSILQALRPVLSDSIPEDEDPDEDETEQQIRLGNLSLKFVDETISQAQGQHEQQSS
ncbi:hypothetical protein [Arthrospira platensis]|uniref:Uncharacterized protein n=1 Tax=Limnospira platensis NIES-46 TaxID=1236695 RepID=A0A5M3SYW2_LIMPL|nr:hypothetical protein [Arthrospira platensis]AMW29422.1 hypothetical protein AP285_17220 [Arthrospira platensis YZ]KDR56788.1 hypothetical protein APPUASWS_015025 [Arthrospira platensis str. Paraca]MBD2670044.1 hypothetical protein [Arthrospira platensis FACHB-439]MBD2710736.1 hypothetical protein [Arthrospira platensis FACHB-835]MDT9311127.1 hypothetical protein [Limnospira sp. Paracas R14]QQW27332.1 hypothetical protein AP9108_18895 [Arthrospira sp. PCC 9108]